MALKNILMDFRLGWLKNLFHRDDWEEWYEAMCEILPYGKLTQLKE